MDAVEKNGQTAMHLADARDELAMVNCCWKEVIVFAFT